MNPLHDDARPGTAEVIRLRPAARRPGDEERVVSALEPKDAPRNLELVRGRLLGIGLRDYGPLHMATDPRDFVLAATEEGVDGLPYVQIAIELEGDDPDLEEAIRGFDAALSALRRYAKKRPAAG